MGEEKEKEDSKEEIVVNDRRLLTEEERQGILSETQETESAPSSGGSVTDESSTTDGSAQGEGETPPPDIDTLTLVHLFIGELGARTWMHLGLLQNPVTKLVVKDLPQARLAIDCVAALIEKIGPEISDDERRDYRRLLNDLRMNYVQQSGS